MSFMDYLFPAVTQDVTPRAPPTQTFMDYLFPTTPTKVPETRLEALPAEVLYYMRKQFLKRTSDCIALDMALSQPTSGPSEEELERAAMEQQEYERQDEEEMQLLWIDANDLGAYSDDEVLENDSFELESDYIYDPSDDIYDPNKDGFLEAYLEAGM